MNFLIAFLLVTVLGFWLARKLIFWFLVLALMFIIGSNNSPNQTPVQVEKTIKILSFDELYNYPVDCRKKDQQLAELTKLQEHLNFDTDPDNLSKNDAIYDGRLNATIWYFYHSCEQ